MWDVAYLLVTLLFFAAMLWYVQGCEALGGKAGADDAEEKRGASSRRRNGGGN
jgi:hypothetical protein